MTAILIKIERVAVHFGDVFSDMSPYLLFGFFAAGLLSVLISTRHVERHLGGHGFWPVLKAALLGIPLPLCSCSVLPVTASLRKHGAGRGGATAFLISTPQTGVDSILVTYSLLGPVFAIFKPAAALVSGMVGGVAVDALEPHGEADDQEIEDCQDACCSEDQAGRSKLSRAMRYGFIELPRDIGVALIIGILVAGAIAIFVPEQFFVGVRQGTVAILVMMALGIPVYVCSTASVPIAAALMMRGVSPGAALAFLMTGPATNAAGIATVWRIMGRRTALIYLGAVAATAFASGLLLDALWNPEAAEVAHAGHAFLPPPVKWASGIVLLVVLSYAILRRGPEEHADHDYEDGTSCCHPEQEACCHGKEEG